MISRLAPNTFLYLAWAQALVATLGSLFFSEILRYPPCTLCWYQRIFIYPLVLIIPIGILRRDTKLYQYILPLSSLGWIIAFYQTLLQSGLFAKDSPFCQINLSCTTKHINYFGFITIPLLSLAAFTFINICLLLYRRSMAGKNNP